MLKKGTDRHQLQMICLDAVVDKLSPVRVVDAFVDMLDLEALAFNIKGKHRDGAPRLPCRRFTQITPSSKENKR